MPPDLQVYQGKDGGQNKRRFVGTETFCQKRGSTKIAPTDSLCMVDSLCVNTCKS
jgi:hypothetical protein